MLLRDVEVLATGADERALANADVRPALERLTTRIAASAACARSRRSIARSFALERNAGVKIVADWLVLQL